MVHLARSSSACVRWGSSHAVPRGVTVREVAPLRGLDGSPDVAAYPEALTIDLPRGASASALRALLAAALAALDAPRTDEF